MKTASNRVRVRPLLVAVGLFVWADVHAPAGRAGGQSLRESLLAQMAAHEAMPWSMARPLAWSDFRGAPVLTGQEGARTAYGLFYAVRCVKREFEYRVVAAFLPKDSWVKPAVVVDPAESRRTLGHEQTHFDLAEIYARRMRETFSLLPNPCGRPEAELDSLAERFVRAEDAMQRTYDAETRHGLSAADQTRWDEQVARDLAALRKYIQ
jgi:hypothetical protein